MSFKLKLFYQVDFVPKFHVFLEAYDRYYLITDFIEGGIKYDDFSEMPRNALEACRDAIVRMHKTNLYHDDLEGQSFIVQNDNKAYLIDFRYSKFVKQKKKLQEEMEAFLNETKLYSLID